MSTPTKTSTVLHVNVAPYSIAEQTYMPSQRRKAEVTDRVIAAGIKPNASYDLYYNGGHTITNLQFTIFYIGGSGKWQNSDQANIDGAIAAAMSDRRMNNVMQQYFSQTISSTFKPSTVLNDAAPNQINQAQTEQMLTTMYQQNQLAGYDYTSTVFCFVCPSGTVLTDNGSVTSLNGLGGYHGQVSTGGVSLYYAIVAYAENLSGGGMSGIVAFDQPWKNITAALYHELNEARTDSDVSGKPGWISNPILDFGGQQSEIGDTPVFEAGNNLKLVFQEVARADGNGTIPVQFMYSNAVHGPEGPRDTVAPAASTAPPPPGGGLNLGAIVAIIVVIALAVGAYFLFFHH